MPNVLIVVDMLVGFMEEGHNLYCGDEARGIIPKVQDLIDIHQRSGSQVIFVCDSHEKDDLEFEMFPVHCLAGTREAEIIPELIKYEGHVLYKKRYSAFFNTDLESTLSELDPEKISICGVCTDICVMHTAADARNRDYRVEVIAETVASFDESAHINALTHMESILGVSVIR